MCYKSKTINPVFVAVIVLGLIILGHYGHFGRQDSNRIAFDKDRAFKDAAFQVSLGPRLPLSKAHEETIFYIERELLEAGWKVEKQVSTYLDKSITNIIARRGNGNPLIILGAHYDTRSVADKDPDPAKRTQPVPGANDGASGVAVLLELGRSLPYYHNSEIWLVFFDAEDQGNIPGWEWIIGSTIIASQLSQQVEAAVIIDMIGDMDLNIKIEHNSDPDLVEEIWEQAADLGYSGYFLQQQGYNILDDHTPFIEKGIKAVDIIDFDYPYWHTTSDTIDKISPESLGVVGLTVSHWLDGRFK